MATQEQIEVLKTRLQKLEEERRAIQNLLDVWLDTPDRVPAEAGKSESIQQPNKSYSIRGRIVDAVIELIHSKGRAVTNEEILQYVDGAGRRPWTWGSSTTETRRRR